MKPLFLLLVLALGALAEEPRPIVVECAQHKFETIILPAAPASIPVLKNVDGEELPPLRPLAGGGLGLYIPVNTTAGEYRSEQIVVRVLPFALPAQQHLKVTTDFAPSAEGADAKRAWLRALQEYRLGLRELVPPPVFVLHAGKVRMEASAFDDAARQVFDRVGLGACFAPKLDKDPTVLLEAQLLFTKHLREHGWLERFVFPEEIVRRPHDAPDLASVPGRRLWLTADLGKLAPGAVRQLPYLCHRFKAEGLDLRGAQNLAELRDGLEDFEALGLLKERLSQAAGRPTRLAEHALTAAADSAPDLSKLAAARRLINAGLVSLQP